MNSTIRDPDPKRFARKRAEERRAQIQRVRDINAPRSPGPDGEDHGMDLGPAAIARGGDITRVGGRISGAAQKHAAPVYARIIDASTLFERMNLAAQISDREAKAGHRLVLLKRAAGIEPRVTARYAVVHDKIEEAVQDGEVIEAVCPDNYDPRTYYRFVLRQLPDHMAHLVDSACDWSADRPTGHPGVQFLATFQIALQRLCGIFGITQ